MTSTIRYKLPQEFGGVEVGATEYEKDGNTWLWFPFGEWMMHCRAEALTKVEPQLPPEPPIGTVLLDGGDRAWQRVRDDRDPPWRHDSLMCSWETMVRYNSPLTALVPDPADDAPELPWADGEDETEDKVHASAGNVYVHITPGYILPEEAELRAAVILRAVRQARAAREVEKP